MTKRSVFILPANRRGLVPAGLGVEHELGAYAIDRELENLGYAVRVFDVHDRPWNPFARKASMLKAIDPLRALKIIFSWPRPDIVLSYFESGALLLAAARAIGILSAPIVIVDIGVQSGSRLRDKILKFVIPRVSAIFALGSDQVDHIKNHYKTKAHVEFLPAHVDAEFYTPQLPRVDGGYILAVGDDRSRDYRTLLKAVEGLGIELVLKTKLVSENKSQHPNLSVINRRMSHLEFRELYDRAKLVVMPLHPVLTAGGVTAFLEAMAMGKPQIVSDSAGLRDYVREGENAVVVPCGDVVSLRRTILQLLGDDGLRRRLGESSRDCAKRRFSSQNFAQQLADQFKLLTQRGNGVLTKRDPSEYLKKHIESILARGELHKCEIIDIFRRCRKVLEQDGTKDRYPIISLYADWLVHNSLDRNAHAFEMLERIATAMDNLGSNEDLSKIITAISAALGIRDLRRELIALTAEKGAPSDLFKSFRAWNFIVGALFEELVEYEISFPTDICTNPRAKGRKQFERMVAAHEPHMLPNESKNRLFLPYSLWITDKTNEPGVPGRPPGLYFNVRMNPLTEDFPAQYNGQVVSTETMSDFEAP